jgi:uncharacterized repeat protein (TIGR03803 family)
MGWRTGVFRGYLLSSTERFGTSTSDGATPTAGLVRDSSGHLYGTTSGGGPFGSGTVFKLSSTRKETLLHSFSYVDGANPNGGLLRDSAGNFYGTTSSGGTYGYGIVFTLTP